MDDLIFIALAVFFLLVFPWILLARARVLRNRLREDFETRIADLTARIYALENSIKSITNRLADGVVVGPRETAAPQPAPAAKTDAPPAPFIATVPSTPSRSSEHRPLPSELVAKLANKPSAATDTSTGAVGTEQAPVNLPMFLQQGPATTSLYERMKGGLDLEEVLGTNWLNKIGIVILVFGIAFFLAYQLKELGPAGKVMVGYIVSIALLGIGLLLERNARYSILGRAGLGGGWALAFFTTYAMGYVDAARIISSPLLDLVFMGIVAAAMVAHSLKYRSQVVTGLAFLLAFSTVTISHVTVYSLTAGALLSAGLVIIVLKMRWWELEIFGILAAYLNHFYWLWHIIEPMQGHKHPFPEFIPSAGILVFYWLIYRVSYVSRSVDNIQQERLATAAALLNSFGLLSLLKYQSVHPEWAFWALLVLGSAELVMAFVAARKRRTAFLVLATIGVAMLFAAVPFRYSGVNVSVLWVVGCEALLFAGIFTDETLFRRLSFVVAIATTIQAVGVDAARTLGVRMDGAIPGRDLKTGIALAVAGIVFYLNAEYVKRRWPVMFDDHDSRALRLISYAAMALTAASLWVCFPGPETAPAWALGALALAFLASHIETPDMKIQADFLVALVFLRVVFVNFEVEKIPGHVSQRLVTVAMCALALYAASRAKPVYQFAERFYFPDVYTWLASAMATTLMWYELHSVGIAPAWALFGLVLVEVGLRRGNVNLRVQGYFALLCAIIRVFIANLAADGEPGALSPRIYSIVPIVAALFYLYERLRDSSEDSFEHRWHLADLSAWAATACFLGLVRYELPMDWVVVGWAVLVPLLLAIAWRSGRLIFLHQAMLLSWLTIFRGTMHNLIERSLAPAPFWYSRWLCVGVACALLFLSLPLAYKLLGAQSETASDSRFKIFVNSVVRRPEQTVFFAAFALIVALLTAEMSKGMLTISWSAFGVLTFLFALWLGERSFRLAGLILLLAGVAKIALVDVWSLGPRDRYLTFISMGAALLLVSYLYTRFNETLRQYL